MTAQRLNRIHVENLCQLIQLREAILRDIVEACICYSIDRKTAECYGNASDEELHELAFSVEESLFPPRFRGEDLCLLLKSPPEIRGIVAAVHRDGTRKRVPSRGAGSTVSSNDSVEA